MGRPRVALIALVRDEEGRVARLLESVRDVIDSWLIIDTGSVDGTRAEVLEVLDGVPGVLLDRRWVDFGSNRSELVGEAQQRLDSIDWLLPLDADHELCDAPLLMTLVEETMADAFLFPFDQVPQVWTPRLLRAGKPWSYVGRTREYLACGERFRRERVDAPRILDHADGASRAAKWRRDIGLLREDLSEDPSDARRWYYLGESYRGIDQFDAAAAAYTNCAVLTKSGEERYLALTMSGEMFALTGQEESAVQRLLLANSERPGRREALLMACQLLNHLGLKREVRSLLGSGDVRRAIPPNDVMGVLPGAYGELMEAEQRRSGRH